MKFAELAQYFEIIEKENLRNKKTEILAELFAKIDGEEMAAVSYLILGRVTPRYDSTEIGMAEKQVLGVIENIYGKDVTHIYKKLGDLGEVVEEVQAKYSGKINEKSILDVYNQLKKIADEGGMGSVERKKRMLYELIHGLSGLEAKYVIRLIMGKIRLGFSDLTMLDALSWARCGNKSDRVVLENAYNVWNDMGEVARQYKNDGVEGVVNAQVIPGRPVAPMRAERLGTIEEIVARLQEFAVEPKLDGMRVQIHCMNKDRYMKIYGKKQQNDLFATIEDNIFEVKIYSRGLEDITHQFPEIVQAAKIIFERIGEFVFDGEVIGIDPQTNQFLPFQETVKRKRKHDVGMMQNEIPVNVYVFDVLYANGKDLTKSTYKERRVVLEKLICDSNVIKLTESRLLDNVNDTRDIFQKYVKQKLEGMLCKKLDSKYRAGARDYNWVKYKKAHESDLADTLDCVVMGYYVGKGKRSSFGLGAFLVGILKEEEVVTIAKIGTGISDEMFGILFEKLSVIKTKERDSRFVVDDALVPDFWVQPEIVVEIEADEITISPIHSAGYALRFPRLIKIRNDKMFKDITNISELKTLL